MQRWTWFAAALLIACGGGGNNENENGNGNNNAVDAGQPDADLSPIVCDRNFELASIAAHVELGAANQGFDIDGDNILDNALGSADGLKELLDPEIAASVDDGDLLFLTEYRDLADLNSDANPVTVAFYGAVDGDTPANPADNFDGNEGFLFGREWVDQDCNPVTAATGGYTSGTGTVTASSQATVPVNIPPLGGVIDVARPRFQTDLEADTAGVRSPNGESAMFGGAILQCALANGPAVVLWDNPQAALASLGVQPDIDLDGDGAESVQVAGFDIVSCTDGDGTVIDGANCGCDPRMADGYSFSFVMDLRGATILGIDQ
jgi:hypothetical protein